MNQKVKNSTQINLKGLIIGNGCFDWKLDGEPSEFEFLYMHNVINRDLFVKWRDNDCFWSYDDIYPHTEKQDCIDAWNKKNDLTEDIDVYDIYRGMHAKD